MFIPHNMTSRYWRPAGSPLGRRRLRGASLIELIMFMVIVSVGLAGILSVMNITTKSSADPMVRKQAIAIAESLLEEIELQAFTYCDPEDPIYPAGPLPASSAGCLDAFTQDTLPLGSQAANQLESRGSITKPYDNVSDYHGYSRNPVRDNTDTLIGTLGAYQEEVTITQALPGVFGLAKPEDALRIDVRVQSGSAVDITLTGYRLRYAPNTTP
jgi:MSHA pilin protein MshD